MSFEFVPCAYLILYSTQNNRELSQILVDEHHKFGISRDEDEVTFKALCFIYLCSQKKLPQISTRILNHLQQENYGREDSPSIASQIIVQSIYHVMYTLSCQVRPELLLSVRIVVYSVTGNLHHFYFVLSFFSLSSGARTYPYLI